MGGTLWMKMMAIALITVAVAPVQAGRVFKKNATRHPAYEKVENALLRGDIRKARFVMREFNVTADQLVDQGESGKRLLSKLIAKKQWRAARFLVENVKSSEHFKPALEAAADRCDSDDVLATMTLLRLHGLSSNEYANVVKQKAEAHRKASEKDLRQATTSLEALKKDNSNPNSLRNSSASEDLTATASMVALQFAGAVKTTMMKHCQDVEQLASLDLSTLDGQQFNDRLYTRGLKRKDLLETFEMAYDKKVPKKLTPWEFALGVVEESAFRALTAD